MLPVKWIKNAPWCAITGCKERPTTDIKDYHEILGGITLLICDEHYKEYFGGDKNTFRVKEIFTYKKRVCVIVETRIGGFSHNGYVSLLGFHKNKDYEDIRDIDADELTYSGFLEHYSDDGKAFHKATYFVGFDSNHYWNDEHPCSKTFESVKARTIELADELIKRGY